MNLPFSAANHLRSVYQSGPVDVKFFVAVTRVERGHNESVNSWYELEKKNSWFRTKLDPTGIQCETVLQRGERKSRRVSVLRALYLEGEAEPRHRPWASKFVLSRFPRRNLPLFFQEVRGLIRELQPADF